MTLTFNSLRATVITYSNAKDQRERLVGSKYRVDTNGQTEGGDCITGLTNAVSKHAVYLQYRTNRMTAVWTDSIYNNSLSIINFQWQVLMTNYTRIA